MELEILGILGARKEVPARLNGPEKRETQRILSFASDMQGHLPAIVSFDEP